MKQPDLFDMEKGAHFSECRKYRYALWRIWDKSLPMVMFIGLNPSTANEDTDDPTIRRVIRFARDWGYGGVYMMNLFGLISSKPKALLTHGNPVGENDQWLDDIACRCNKVIFAWGAFKQAKARMGKVIAMFPKAECLLHTADGSPGHPLFVPADTQPIKY